MSASPLEGLRVAVFGNSYPNWPDPWAYVKRLAARHQWTVSSRAVGGERSVDTAARVIAGPAPYVHGRADLVIVDATTNDFMASGAAGLTGYRNALTALLAYLSLEGVITDARTDVIAYSGSWAVSAGPEWGQGSQRAMTSTAAEAHLGTFRRGGRWAVGYYGLAEGTGNGDAFVLEANGVRVGGFSTHRQAVQPGPSSVRAFDGGPRNWTAAAELVTLPEGCPELVLRRDGAGQGGGPYLDWYGKLNDINPPTIVCAEPLRLTAAGYARNGAPGVTTDAVVAAYAAVLREVATEVGPHVVVAPAATGWDPATMLLSDDTHPNAWGSAHITAAVEAAALEGLTA